ncbi:MAG: ATP-binding cassette domain-containing protein [Polyangiales bacterium]
MNDSGTQTTPATNDHDRDAHGASDAHAHGASPTERLFGLLRGETRDLWVVLTYAVGVGLLSLVVPIATASLVNTVSFGTMIQPLVVLTFLVLVGLSFEGLMRALQFWVVEVLQRRVFVKVALDLARRLPRVHAAAFDRASGPELVNRFFDVLTVQKTAATLLLDGLAVLLQALIGTLLLAFYHPILLAFDAVLVAGMFVILVPLGRGAIDTSLQESKAKYAVAAWLEEIARLTHAFRGGAPADFAERRADQLSQRYLSARAAHFAIVFRQHVGSLTFKAVLSAALLGVGGWLVIQRGLTIGQLAAAELVVTAVVAGMAKFAKQLESWYDLVTAADKLGHLTDLPLERTDGHEVPDASPRGVRLELRAVTFSHDGRSDALRGVSLGVAPGARVAVLGRSGSGKSTLAELITGRRVPQSGNVFIEGADLRELSLDAVRAAVAVVRDVEIFDGTVAENVAVGRPGVTPDRVRAALSALRLDDEVAALSEGVNTWLSTRGAPLSATQAHTLMFARAIASQPRMIIVDGALDGLDVEVVRDVMGALTAPGAPWTLLVLTHRDEIAAMCTAVHRLERATLTPATARREV